ncbi:hypothetical protein HNQ02_001624 [Flavobacterium sp. 7E]|uniref:DUF6503 family protein n=1 Tax=Flavobacterium sp. 7E TaxID=2735898 RepID=UPI0020C5F555|nr:DUF6503 family protein [Flavobacterium sp. 7E]NRS88706.1 hypothetical protein [Flavobacterium sp. 7E]
MANYNTNLHFSALIKSLFVLCFLVFFKASAQEITGEQLLDKAINYHDPNHHYNDFKGTLSIAMKMPDDSERLSKVSIDLPKQYFKLSVTKNDKVVTYIIDNEVVNFSLDGKSDFTEEDVKTFNLTETRARFMQNYYTYLYGLPMKLKDAGTIINPVVERKVFMGQEYLVLAVKYEEGVGKDAWYFYFDPKTYALKVYQFYHDQTKNDGEYILLSGEEELSGIKIPKARAWYLNQDDKYLATDTLSKS